MSRNFVQLPDKFRILLLAIIHSKKKSVVTVALDFECIYFQQMIENKVEYRCYIHTCVHKFEQATENIRTGLLQKIWWKGAVVVFQHGLIVCDRLNTENWCCLHTYYMSTNQNSKDEDRNLIAYIHPSEKNFCWQDTWCVASGLFLFLLNV